MTEGPSINQKLLKMQQELKAPKGQYNSFGRYNYRSAEDILEAVKPINDKHGLLLTLSDEPVAVGDRVYIKATAKLTDDKNFVSVTAYAREALTKKGMDDSQITGTASSYARKYALNGLYLIDDTKDADTDEYTNQNNQQASQQQQNNQQAPPQNQPVIGKAILLAKFKQGGKTEEEFNAWYADQLSKGYNNNQIDQILTQALMKKANEQ